MAAATRKPPYGPAQDNEFNVRKFTGGDIADTQNHQTDELVEYRWSGKYVSMLAVGGNCHFAMTRFATAEVDRAVAATEAGATTKVGGIALNGVVTDVELPHFNVTDKLYFVRESDAAGVVVYMWLSDDQAIR